MQPHSGGAAAAVADDIGGCEALDLETVLASSRDTRSPYHGFFSKNTATT